MCPYICKSFTTNRVEKGYSDKTCGSTKQGFTIKRVCSGLNCALPPKQFTTQPLLLHLEIECLELQSSQDTVMVN